MILLGLNLKSTFVMQNIMQPKQRQLDVAADVRPPKGRSELGLGQLCSSTNWFPQIFDSHKMNEGLTYVLGLRGPALGLEGLALQSQCCLPLTSCVTLARPVPL